MIKKFSLEPFDGLTIITGPTAVGKTDFALMHAPAIRGTVINADVGQFYTPLTIGTAKPNWRRQAVPHVLFDIVDQPVDISAVDYCCRVKGVASDVLRHGGAPLIVGGSGFYVHSLLFRIPEVTAVGRRLYAEQTEVLWQQLVAIDQVRAHQIDPHDRYRIERALDIWHGTGILPSQFTPQFAPDFNCRIIILWQPTKDLYPRINCRVDALLQQGWIDEVRALETWQPFLLRKKLIGYDDIVRYLHGEISSYDELSAVIAQKTRHYAKRQLTFMRMLTKKGNEHGVPVTWVEMEAKT